jgi:lipoyl(octanoyl) transferase
MATTDVSALRAAPVDYHVALDWQRATADSLRRAGGPEALALIEHDAVYTMGARGGRSTILAPLETLPAPLVDTDRGGDITWHGPGQLVAYPILDLRSRGLRAADYVRHLEAVLIDTLAACGIRAEAVRGRPGVWSDGAKVAAIGVSIRGGISLHGIALNVAPDLAWYNAIVPCGIADASVTSMAELLGAEPALDEVVQVFRAAFERRFDVRLVDADASALRAAGASVRS